MECPGGCGWNDLPSTSIACPECMRRLPNKILDGLKSKGEPLLPWIARANIWFQNTHNPGM